VVRWTGIAYPREGAWARVRFTGVAVLLKFYVHCVNGQATAANQRIAEALGTPDAEEDPGDEGDGDMEQAS
jgi:hypothetical protein